MCGFTEGKGSRKHFGALLLGGYRNGRLRYFGHSGTGFSEKGLKEAIDRLKPLFIEGGEDADRQHRRIAEAADSLLLLRAPVFRLYANDRKPDIGVSY